MESGRVKVTVTWWLLMPDSSTSSVCCSSLSSELHSDYCYIGVTLRKLNTQKLSRTKSWIPLECMTSSQWDTHGCTQIKHFQVQTVAHALLRWWGTRRHFRWLSNPFSASQYWVSFWQEQSEICSLCSGRWFWRRNPSSGLSLFQEIFLFKNKQKTKV